MVFIPRVWAPDATSMDLVTYPTTSSAKAAMTNKSTPSRQSAHTPMVRCSTRPGWWEGTPLAVGDDYAFAPEGRGPFPDPRSRFQPEGVDGPSRAWQPDPSHQWVPQPDIDAMGAVFEEIHVGTFSHDGTLDSAIHHLGHLKHVGVDVVELMPVAEASGHFGWGYDGVDLFAVHHVIGGPEQYVRFVDAAHQTGLLVCQDVVLNHLGPWGNYLSQFGPYYSDSSTNPWGPAFDLDGVHAAEPRRFLIDVVRWWMVDMHVDVVRLDAVHAIVDHSSPHLLQELATRVKDWEKETGRRLWLVAESDLNQPSTVSPLVQGGMGMDMQWADDVHHALYVATTGDTSGYYADFAHPDALPHTLEDVFYHDGTYSTFRQHVWGAPVPKDMDRRRFVVFSQNHDQVGNRAQGDRPTAHTSDSAAAAVAALVLLGPFTPLLFQGEEWGTHTPFCYFADQETEERAENVREGRAREFAQHGWSGTIPDPTDLETVRLSTLDWSQLDQSRCQRMLSWYRDLIALRHTTPSVTAGRRAGVVVEGTTVYLLNGTVLVEANLSGHPLPDRPNDLRGVPRSGASSVVATFPAKPGTPEQPGNPLAVRVSVFDGTLGH